MAWALALGATQAPAQGRYHGVGTDAVRLRTQDSPTTSRQCPACICWDAGLRCHLLKAQHVLSHKCSLCSPSFCPHDLCKCIAQRMKSSSVHLSRPAVRPDSLVLLLVESATRQNPASCNGLRPPGQNRIRLHVYRAHVLRSCFYKPLARRGVFEIPASAP